MSQKENRQTIFQNPIAHQLLNLVLVILGIWFFSFLTKENPPKSLGAIYKFYVQENSILLLTLVGGYFLLNLIPGKLGKALRWFWMLFVFAGFMQGIWLTKRTAYFQLYGIQPWVDATEYYANAQRLLLGYASQGTTNARPFFSAFLAVLLWVGQLDMIRASIYLLFIVAVAYYIFSENLRKQFGYVAAALAMAVTFMFFRNYLGAFSSEGLGISLGMGGWIILFWGASRKNLPAFCVGLFFTTIAFITRAGPFIVLPTVILAGIWIFRQRYKIWLFLVSTIATVVSGFGINSIVLNTFSSGKSVAFTSYIYSLYGMAAGGKSWGYIKVAHPDVFFGMAEPERTQKIISLTIELIKSNPFDLIKSMLSQYYFFTAKMNTSVFSYLFARVDSYNIAIMVIFYALSILGIVILVRKWKNSTSLLILAILVGVLISVPLVPPQDESDMRPYAVAVPIINLIPALAMEFIFRRLPLISRIQHRFPIFLSDTAKPSLSLPALVYSGALLVILFTIPFGLYSTAKPQQIETTMCPAGEMPYVWIHLDQNTTFIRKNTEWNGRNWMTIGQAERLKHDILYKYVEFFDELKVETEFSQSVNILDHRSAWLIGDGGIYQPGNGYYRGCGIYVDNPTWWGFNYFRLSSAEFVQKLE